MKLLGEYDAEYTVATDVDSVQGQQHLLVSLLEKMGLPNGEAQLFVKMMWFLGTFDHGYPGTVRLDLPLWMVELVEKEGLGN